MDQKLDALRAYRARREWVCTEEGAEIPQRMGGAEQLQGGVVAKYAIGAQRGGDCDRVGLVVRDRLIPGPRARRRTRPCLRWYLSWLWAALSWSGWPRAAASSSRRKTGWAARKASKFSFCLLVISVAKLPIITIFIK